MSIALETPPLTTEVLPYGVDTSWYAAYIFPRHEKAAAATLEQKGLEVFLPMFSVVRQWKDRRTKITQPMFPGYLFTRISLRDRTRVLATPSVLRIVSNNGIPSPIPDSEIDSLQRCLAGGLAEPHPFLGVGERVRVKSGAFEGIEGIGLRRTNHYTLVISIQLIHQSVALEIPFDQLEKVNLPKDHNLQSHSACGTLSPQ